MYRALYRKYRPQTFDDVVGQQHIVDTLRNQIVTGKTSHAYMFTGTRGTGKTTCAKILARAVNCEHPLNGDPCNECPTCKGIANGSILDVYEIDAASNNGVDNIRELREDVMFTPATARFKVYIIDEVHMMTAPAFNALLKTLEEPPEHIIFIFATTDINKVPQTILSRCQRFDFKRISASDIKKRVIEVAANEGVTLEDDAAALISRLADGALRDALSILDRCIGGSEAVTLETVETTVGVCSYDSMCTFLSAVANDDTAAVLGFYDQWRTASRDSLTVFSELCTYLRDMMMYKITGGNKSVLSYGGEKAERICSVADMFTLEKLSRSIEILQNGIYDISRFRDKHIMAELALIKLTTPALGGDLSDITARIAALEAGAPRSPAPSAAPEKTEPVKANAVTQTAPAPEKKPDTDPGEQQTDDIMQSLVDSLRQNGQSALIPLLNGKTAKRKGNVLYITCGEDEFEFELLNSSANLAALTECAKQFMECDAAVIIKGESAPAQDNGADAFSELLGSADDIIYEE